MPRTPRSSTNDRLANAPPGNVQRTRALGSPRRIVVKIGSAVIAGSGVLDQGAVARIADDLAGVLDADTSRQIVIVSSGAVASGFRALGLDRSPKPIMLKQAAAAIGQPRLMGAWAEAFGVSTRTGSMGTHARAVAQVLLTAEDIDHRARFLNARHTLETLLDAGVVPIINENDSVSFAEIKLGDNDHLSALVASLVSADLLVILSGVAGVWDSDAPRRSGEAPTIVASIASLSEGLRHVRTSKSDVGTGGMATKIKAACTAASLGTRVVIADGGVPGIVGRIVAGEAIGTQFPVPARGRDVDGAAAPMTAARKRWIGFSARPKGWLTLDDGARTALIQRGASLLAAGVRAVEGSFAPGALVELRDASGHAFARGLVNYGDEDVRAIAGKKTSQIAEVLGYHYSDEVVHRDDLVILEEVLARAEIRPAAAKRRGKR